MYIYVKFCTICMCTGGAVVESWATDLKDASSPPLVFFSLPSHGAPSVILRILPNFTLYLRNSWSINLRAIENCICGLRSIECKMRSILRTVYDPPLPSLVFPYSSTSLSMHCLWPSYFLTYLSLFLYIPFHALPMTLPYFLPYLPPFRGLSMTLPYFLTCLSLFLCIPFLCLFPS